MSLERIDEERLARIIDFIQDELNDFKKKFLSVSYENYKTNSDIRRNIERCIENIVNGSLDIAKILLLTEKMAIPDTYREYFLTLGTANLIDKATADILANGVKLRNVLAHQYLDIRWEKIKQFLSSEWKAYEILTECVRQYVRKTRV